ncbi:MAG: hypothetical protein JEZ09_00645 [Salinivirgaceae bacterium]|nr:hypothetical protein [Salinivirgaceae bacterium]
MLIGQSTNDKMRVEIKEFLESRPEIKQVFNLISIQLGTQIMVAVKVKMATMDSVDLLISGINTCELELKKEHPAIKWVFFEPDNRD